MNAFQTRVSKVGRVLAASGGGHVVTRQGTGYRLDMDPACVDVHRFASLIDKARRAGSADETIGLFDEALATWRPEPFVDFAGECLVGAGDHPAGRTAARRRRRTRRTDGDDGPV